MWQMWMIMIASRIISVTRQKFYEEVFQAFIVYVVLSTISKKSNIMNDIWYFHIGATNNLTNHKDWLQKYKPIDPPIIVRYHNNATKQA